MQIYRIFDSALSDQQAQYEGTMSCAHEFAKTIVNRPDARIEMVEAPNDKGAILLYLNGEVNQLGLQVLKSWALTSRGGLKEIPNGE